MVMLFDSNNLSPNVAGIVFATKQQEIVAEMLLAHIKESGGELTKAEMSSFATKLHEGATVFEASSQFHKKSVKISYNKKQFYDRILTPLKLMGCIEYDLHKKVYRASSKFSRTLNRIGEMWNNELRKPLERPIEVHR